MSGSYVHTFSAMGTVITIQLVNHRNTPTRRTERESAVARATEWFHEIERCCTRFDPASELRLLSTRIGEAVPASPMLLEAARFALAVAAETDGAFDPTVGHRMETLGFDREHRTGASVRSDIDAGSGGTWRDVVVDSDRHTITLLKPLLLDFGAVAKGLAVDMAVKELAPYEDFAIDAGGDLYLAGLNGDGAPWSVGIRHPRQPELIETLHVTGTAVCTSGDYERVSIADNGRAAHHILDPRAGSPADGAASVTVLAPSAMVADALATAAFVLGVTDGLALLAREGVEGMIVTPDLQRFSTAGMESEYRTATRES